MLPVIIVNENITEKRWADNVWGVTRSATHKLMVVGFAWIDDSAGTTGHLNAGHAK